MSNEPILNRMPMSPEELDALPNAQAREQVRQKLMRYVARGIWANDMLRHLDRQPDDAALLKAPSPTDV